MLRVEDKYDWFNIEPVDLDDFRDLRDQYHHAIQNVGAVGRMYLGQTEGDSNASLSWVPGLWRLVGKWIDGIETFRSSISFHDFTIYLVNKKVKTLASLSLGGKTQNQILVWLEEQIINLNLSSSHLQMNLPYRLPDFRTAKKGEKFSDVDPHLCEIMGGHFHNAFFLFSKMKEVYRNTTDIVIHPREFTITMQIILKQTDEAATNTYMEVGFNPGDEFYGEPYFFVKSWPNIPESKFTPMKTRGIWHDDDWVGAVYLTRNLWDSDDQESTTAYFFEEATSQIRKLLLT